MRTTPKPLPDAVPPAPSNPLTGKARGFVPRIDSPLRILRDLKEGRLAPGSLSQEQRRSVLVVLAHGKLTHAALAELLGVGIQTIRNDMAHVRRLVGGEARKWTGDDLVGMVLMAADTFSAQAVENGDLGLAWSIQRDLLDQLRKLGVGVDPALQGGGGIKVTIETIGEGYAKTRGLLTQAMDPRLSGEVVVDATPSVEAHETEDEEEGDGEGETCGTASRDEGEDTTEELAVPQVRGSTAAPRRGRMPTLPLPTVRANQPGQDPGRVHVERVEGTRRK